MQAVAPVIVKRSEWGRGNPGAGALFNQHGKCCLGFACEQAGYSPEALKDLAMPSSLFDTASDPIPQQLEAFVDIESAYDYMGEPYNVVGDSTLADDLSGINDDDRSDDKFKEREIIARAAEDGVIFIFVD